MVVLKNHVNIRKTSIKVVKDEEEGGFYLDFMFDSNYECEIQMYLCAQECRNSSIPLYFYTHPEK